MAAFGSSGPQTDEELLIECSSGVALAINTNRTGLIVVTELAGFFAQVNRAYSLPDADASGASRARQILEQVGVSIGSLMVCPHQAACCEARGQHKRLP